MRRFSARSRNRVRSAGAITAWALEWLAAPDNQRSTPSTTPLAQPLHLRPTSAETPSVRSGPRSRRRLRDHDLRQPLTRPSQPASPDGTPPTCAAHPEGCSAGRKCDGGPTSLQLVWTPLVAGDFYDKEPPILLAVRHGHNEILEILLETVRRWRLPDLCLAAPRARISPLGLAAHRNNEEALFLLLMGRCGRPRRMGTNKAPGMADDANAAPLGGCRRPAKSCQAPPPPQALQDKREG